MASSRDTKLLNQIRFRNERIYELENRSLSAWLLIQEAIDAEFDAEAEQKLVRAQNILAEHEAI